MCTLTDSNGFEYNVRFEYHFHKRQNPKTICKIKKVSTGEIFEGEVKCYEKEDNYSKWLGRRKAFEKAIATITNDKVERLIFWKGFFLNIKKDPYRVDFFKQNYPELVNS